MIMIAILGLVRMWFVSDTLFFSVYAMGMAWHLSWFFLLFTVSVK